MILELLELVRPAVQVFPGWTLFGLFLLLAGTGQGIRVIVVRWIRHRNIVAQGWPPAHVDADGGFREEDS